MFLKKRKKRVWEKRNEEEEIVDESIDVTLLTSRSIDVM